MQDAAPGRTKVGLLGVLSLVGSWFLFYVSWPIAATFVVAGGGYLVSRSRAACVTILLLSPFLLMPVLFALRGVWAYASAEGCFLTCGFFHDGNLDRRYRCHWRATGCVINGSEILTQTSHNLALAAMIRMFGPMRGSYAGSYPTRWESRQALEKSAIRFPPDELSVRALNLGLISEAALPELLRSVTSHLDRDPIVAAVFEEDTLVLGLKDRRLLVDRETGRIYAFYHSSGDEEDE